MYGYSSLLFAQTTMTGNTLWASGCGGHTLDCFREMFISNLCRNTLYPDTFRGFQVSPSICRNSTSDRPIPLNPNHFQFIFSSPITLPSPKLRTASTRVLTTAGPPALPLNIIYTPLIFWPYLQRPWLSKCPTSCPFFVAYVVPKDPSKSEAFWYIL